MPGFVSGGVVPAAQRGTQSYEFYHVTDWLPTIVGRASTGSASGSGSGVGVASGSSSGSASASGMGMGSGSGSGDGSNSGSGMDGGADVTSSIIASSAASTGHSVSPLDGHDIWTSLSTGGKSPRTELVYNVNPICGSGQAGPPKVNNLLTPINNLLIPINTYKQYINTYKHI